MVVSPLRSFLPKQRQAFLGDWAPWSILPPWQTHRRTASLTPPTGAQRRKLLERRPGELELVVLVPPLPEVALAPVSLAHRPLPVRTCLL